MCGETSRGMGVTAHVFGTGGGPRRSVGSVRRVDGHARTGYAVIESQPRATFAADGLSRVASRVEHAMPVVEYDLPEVEDRSESDVSAPLPIHPA